MIPFGFSDDDEERDSGGYDDRYDDDDDEYDSRFQNAKKTKPKRSVNEAPKMHSNESKPIGQNESSSLEDTFKVLKEPNSMSGGKSTVQIDTEQMLQCLI